MERRIVPLENPRRQGKACEALWENSGATASEITASFANCKTVCLGFWCCAQEIGRKFIVRFHLPWGHLIKPSWKLFKSLTLRVFRTGRGGSLTEARPTSLHRLPMRRKRFYGQSYCAI